MIRILSLQISFLLLIVTGCQAQDESSLGVIDFPVSGNESAISDFERGVKLLHSFEYADAATAFRKAQDLDSNMVMAYWGEAMTENHPIWNEQDLDTARNILGRLGSDKKERAGKAVTKRERDYLATAEILFGEGSKEERDDKFASAMATLSTTYPEDNEAKTFYALSILGSCQGTRDFRKYVKAGALALEVFEANPLHPGAAHYAVHSFDDPIHAPLGLEAAEAYASIAPDAAHALHMPSHIFLALGLWAESNATNVRSKAAALKKGRQGLHATWWLTYGYIQSGQIAKAKAEIIELSEKVKSGGSRSMHHHLAHMLAHFIHEFPGELSKEVVDVVDLNKVYTMSGANLAFAEALVAAHNGQSFKDQAERLDVIIADPGKYIILQETEIMQLQLKALEAWQEERRDDAYGILEMAVKIKENMPVEFGPPSPPKPVFEMFADLLLEDEKFVEARNYYDAALLDKPGRRQAIEGLIEIARSMQDEQAVLENSCYLAELLEMADARFDKSKSACKVTL